MKASMFEVEMINGVPEVKPEVFQNISSPVRLIDVRSSEEFVGELGHIKGAELVTLGPDLQAFLDEGALANLKNQTIIFVCRSGARSAQATMYGRQLGYEKVYNLQGGMLRWNSLQLPVQK